MQHKKFMLIPEKKVEVVTHKTCDICKRSDDCCDIDETAVSFRDVKMAFPECGSGRNYSYDICHDCFKQKLIPALRELGAEPSVTDWEY